MQDHSQRRTRIASGVSASRRTPKPQVAGVLSVQDIFSYLQMWFNGEFAADVDHSGAINVGDIYEFLGAWFTGC
jgi:hypothetical protein